MLQCCLNGTRAADVPVDPQQLAREARAVAALGVSSVHVHPRAPHGEETLATRAVGAVVGAIRHAVPGIEVVVPLARWLEPDPFARTGLLQQWAQLPAEHRPDAVAVNVHDDGWQTVCAAAESVGLGIELGMWTPADAVSLRKAGLPAGTLRVVAEVTVTDPDSAVVEAVRLLQALGPVASPILLHGEADATWPVLDYAQRTKLDTRIGLEDTLAGPDGETVGVGNVELVRAAVAQRPWSPRSAVHRRPGRRLGLGADRSAARARRPRHRR